jgi:hypothetical protein
MNIKRVAKMLLGTIDDKAQVLDCNKDINARTEHLHWMLMAVISGDCHDITKENRWIGYVQGCLVACGATTVEDMRDINKKPEGECRHTITIHI